MAAKTIAADGSGDFTTLAAWWDSLPATLTEPEIGQIKGELVTTAVYLPGKVTSPTNYIELRAAPGHKHTGQPGTGARIIGNGTTGSIIDGGCRHYRYVDLELVSNGTGAPILHGSAVTGATLLVSNCIFRAPSMTGTGTMCLWTATTISAVLENSIFISGARCMDSRNVQSMTVRNCTWWSLTDQLVVIAGATTDFKNCYAGRVGGTQQVWSNAATPTGSHNASSDTTATARFTTGSVNSVAGANAFEKPTTGDFRLKTGSVLIDAGVTISGVTTDIIGTSRPQGAGYDIGAFEYGSGASSTPVAFSGSVPNQTGTEGAAFSLGLSTYFSGTKTPFAYSVQSGTLPAGLSLNTSTGVISGTPTTAGVSSGIVIRATDATPDTADSNSFSITINAAGDAENPTLTGSVTFASITQTSYTAQWPAGLDNVAVTGYEYQIGSTAGAWTNAGNSLSAAITGRTAGAAETVYVRAYDAAGLRSTPAISGSVTLLSAGTGGTITVGSALYPIKYSSASVLNESGLRATVLDATTLAQVLNTSGVVCTNGVITITDAALVIGSTYHLAVKTANGWLGVSDGVTAS